MKPKYLLTALLPFVLGISLKVQAQNVGISDIGITPQSLLHIHKNNANAASLLQITNTLSGNGSGKGLTLDVDGSFNVTLNNRMNTSLGFNTNGTQKMIILNGGNVGIGTASPAQKLDVNGNIKLGDNMMVEGNTSWRVYRNLATYNSSVGAAAGAFVITTAQPWNSACMFRVKLEGYFYDNTAPFELTLGAYMYTNNDFYNYGYINIGAKIVNVRLARNITTNTIAIIIGDEGSTYSYPKISVTSFTQGHSGINELYADGWAITQETSLANYDYMITVPNVTTLPVNSPNYIQNQNAAAQTANFWINGTGRANTSFYAPLYTGAGNVAIRPGANSTTAIQLQNAGGTPILNIDAANSYVGIGTTSPGQKLDVSGITQSTGYRTTTGNTNYHHFTRNGGGAAVYINQVDAINPVLRLSSGTESANGNVIFTAENNGNIGIGTTTPSARLHTTGTVRFAGYPSGTNGAIVRTDGSGNLAITNFTGNTSDILLGNNTFGTVAAAGGVTSSCGTANYVPKMNSSTSMACSQIYDNGTNVGVGTTTLPQKLNVEGGIHVKNGSYVDFVNWQWAIGRDINSTFSSNNELQVLGYGSSGNSFQIIGITGSSPSYTYSRILQANFDNGNVGIGTSPVNKLDVEGGAVIGATYSGTNTAPANGMLIEGNVGIGTINPAANLDNGGVAAGGALRTVFARMSEGNSTGSGTFLGIRAWETQNSSWNGKMFSIENTFYGNLNSSIEFYRGGSTTGGFMTFTTNNGTERMRIDASGNVGIGATSPTAQLHTTGTVRFANYPSGPNGAIVRTDASGNLAITNFTGSASNILLGNNTFGTIADAGGVTSSCGTANYVPKMSSSTAMTCSQIYDNGTNVGIGTTSPNAMLHINQTNAAVALRVQLSGSSKLTVGSNGGVTIGTYQDTPPANGLYVAGNVGIGTSSPTEKLYVNGNAKATGYIVAGSATTGSTTRYGSYNITWNTGLVNADGQYHYTGSIATIPIPTGASSITVTKIVWECDAAHEDGNEDHGIWVGVGSSAAGATYYGWWAAVNNGYHYIDWHRVDYMSQYAPSGSNNVYIRTYDESCCNSDYLILYNMNITIYYSYTVGLQDGDIAASGRVYANNTTAIGDLAEHFEYTGPIVPGYVVSFVPGSENEYEPCNQPYSEHITGVLSENPSVVLNSPQQGPAVALAGRVTVKLVKSDQHIKSGDFITSSDQAGLAQKAVHPGPVIGYAVKNQKPGEDFVEVLLQLGKYYVPPAYIDNDYDDEKSAEKTKGKW